MHATVTEDQIQHALGTNPTLTLLKARSRIWVLPLFATHLEAVDGYGGRKWARVVVDLEPTTEGKGSADDAFADCVEAFTTARSPASMRVRSFCSGTWVLIRERLVGVLRIEHSPDQLVSHEVGTALTSVDSRGGWFRLRVRPVCGGAIRFLWGSEVRPIRKPPSHLATNRRCTAVHWVS